MPNNEPCCAGPRQGRASHRLSPAAVTCLMLLAFTLGCHRQPQVAASHRQLIKSLRTAVGAKRSDWLETNAKLIDEQKAQGQLTAEEQQAFDEIVASARAGKWSEAEEQLQSLARAQVPTEEDLERLKARQVEH